LKGVVPPPLADLTIVYRPISCPDQGDANNVVDDSQDTLQTAAEPKRAKSQQDYMK
jgi:hypothetical protein